MTYQISSLIHQNPSYLIGLRYLSGNSPLLTYACEHRAPDEEALAQMKEGPQAVQDLVVCL